MLYVFKRWYKCWSRSNKNYNLSQHFSSSKWLYTLNIYLSPNRKYTVIFITCSLKKKIRVFAIKIKNHFSNIPAKYFIETLGSWTNTEWWVKVIGFGSRLSYKLVVQHRIRHFLSLHRTKVLSSSTCILWLHLKKITRGNGSLGIVPELWLMVPFFSYEDAAVAPSAAGDGSVLFSSSGNRFTLILPCFLLCLFGPDIPGWVCMTPAGSLTHTPGFQPP